MSNSKINAAVTIAQKLQIAEQKVSEAISSLAEFIAYVPQARTAVGLAHGVGHAAVTDGSSVLVKLSEAQGGLSNVHKQVEAIGRFVGVDISMNGPIKEPSDGSSLSIPITGA